MKLSYRLIAGAIGVFMLCSCAHYRATLLPQTDDSYKALGEGSSLDEARAAAKAQATRVCRHQSLFVRKLDETRPPRQGGTVTLIWHFRCASRT